MKVIHASLLSLAKVKTLPGSLLVIGEATQLKESKSLPATIRERIRYSLDRMPAPLEAGASIRLPSRAEGEPDLLVAAIPADPSVFELLGFARNLLKVGVEPNCLGLGVVILDRKLEAPLTDALGAALASRIFPLPVYGKKKEKQKPFLLSEVTLFCIQTQEKVFQRGFATGNGSNLVRYLGILPPNHLTARAFGDHIGPMAKEAGLTVKFIDAEKLKKMGAGAFTAVDQAHPDSGGGIYEISYQPKKKTKNTPLLALVGKGLCFDTGGYDIKVSGGMISMKADMSGAAVALATLVTASELELPLEMKAFLGVTENHISPLGYRPDDVVTALNGISIEVINTDAEGRMVLADTLALASRAKPKMIIDFATLTGSAVRAIGTGYGAGFSNQPKLLESIRKAGDASGERVWPFPIVKSYFKMLDSPVADLRQTGRPGNPDHILAASFLSRFVEDGIDWVHVDMAASMNEGGLAHVESTITGYGVRWAIQFIEDQFL